MCLEERLCGYGYDSVMIKCVWENGYVGNVMNFVYIY